jgi:hypothetical protein
MIKGGNQNIARAKSVQSKSKLAVRVGCCFAKLRRWLWWVLICWWRMPRFDVCSRCTVPVHIDDIAADCAGKRSRTAEQTCDDEE